MAVFLSWDLPEVLVDGRRERVGRRRPFAQGRTQKPLLPSPVPMNISSPEPMAGAGASVIVPASGTATVAPRLSCASWPAPLCLIEASATAIASKRLASVDAF